MILWGPSFTLHSAFSHAVQSRTLIDVCMRSEYPYTLQYPYSHTLLRIEVLTELTYYNIR